MSLPQEIHELASSARFCCTLFAAVKQVHAECGSEVTGRLMDRCWCSLFENLPSLINRPSEMAMLAYEDIRQMLQLNRVAHHSRIRTSSSGASQQPLPSSTTGPAAASPDAAAHAGLPHWQDHEVQELCNARSFNGDCSNPLCIAAAAGRCCKSREVPPGRVHSQQACCAAEDRHSSASGCPEGACANNAAAVACEHGCGLHSAPQLNIEPQAAAALQQHSSGNDADQPSNLAPTHSPSADTAILLYLEAPGPRIACCHCGRQQQQPSKQLQHALRNATQFNLMRAVLTWVESCPETHLQHMDRLLGLLDYSRVHMASVLLLLQHQHAQHSKVLNQVANQHQAAVV